MFEPMRVKLDSPYGSLLYSRGLSHRCIDNGEIGIATVYNEAAMCRVRWDCNADETDVPAHWLACLPSEKSGAGSGDKAS